MSNIIPKGPATDLSVLEQLSPADLFAKGGTLPVYEAIKKEVAAFIADPATEDGRKEIKSMAMKIAKSKTFLDEVGKTFNADLKEKTKAVDAERRVIWDALEALQHKVRKPVTDWEEAEDARVKGHKDAVNEMALAASASFASVAEIQAAIADVKKWGARDWQEFAEVGVPAYEAAIADLEKKLAVAEQAERDRAELEALRAAKAEREARDAAAARERAAAEERARIEREATEKAQREAQAAIQAEKDKAAQAAIDAAAALKAAEERAARDQADAEDRARKAEEARIAAEARAKLEADAAVQAEKDRAAAEQKRLDEAAKERENNRAHHARINNEVMAALAALDCVLGEVPAKAITVAIAEGRIPHVKISY